jgi:hypothetical protein
MSRKLNVTVLVDAAEIVEGDPNFEVQPEVPTTEYHVIQTLRDLGYEVSVLGAVSDIGIIFKTLTDHKPDLVFNLTEAFEGDRNRRSRADAVPGQELVQGTAQPAQDSRAEFLLSAPGSPDSHGENGAVPAGRQAGSGG